jgi:hypothetical protein
MEAGAHMAGGAGPPADVLTLALACTVTVMLAVADTPAVAAASAQASALPLALPRSWTTELPVVARFAVACRARGPWVCTALMIAGRFFDRVVTSVCKEPDALAPHSSCTVGGVHAAVSDAWLSQLAWQFADALHAGGVIWPSHVGAVTITLQAPRHVAIAPQLTPPVAVILQLPSQLPLHVPSQWAGVPGV